MLHVEDVHFAYGKKQILEGISFSVREGEIVALIGVSGSGKTTLFRLINGVIAPSSGRIQTEDLSTYMRQEDLLLPWRNVLDNLLLFTELGKEKKDRALLKEEALILLKKVGLENHEKLYPKELSGGMRQRVALARSLLQNRPLMLLDEPFASLDVIMRDKLYGLLREIREQYRKTLVMVTHDFRDALAMADRILVLAKGKIVGDFRTSVCHQELTQTLITLLQTS